MAISTRNGHFHEKHRLGTRFSDLGTEFDLEKPEFFGILGIFWSESGSFRIDRIVVRGGLRIISR